MKANKLIGLLFLILLLAGCGVNKSLIEKEGNDKEEFSGTLEIGDMIYQNALYNWYYDGIVDDAIVISTSTGRIRYVPLYKNEWINLPYSKTMKIKIKSIDDKTGSIEIDFIKKEE